MTASPVVVRAKALAATDALPPTFPIGTFVAANPLHGLESYPFEQAAAIAAATSGARSFLSEREYRELHDSGRIGDHDLGRAILRRWSADDGRADQEGHRDAKGAVTSFLAADGSTSGSVERSVRTLAEQVDLRAGSDLADRIDAMLASWCSVFLDQGQAEWVLPRRELGLYGAWRRLAPRDPGLRRLVGRAARRRVAELPERAADALSETVAAIGIPEHLVTDYFRASLRRLPGWAAAMSRAGGHDGVVGFLAMRLALEHLAAGEVALDPDQVRPAARSGLPPEIERLGTWQEALELGYRDHLLGLLREEPSSSVAGESSDVVAQVVLCIDVRSEGLRRRLEEVGPYATVGFAGFFGLPVKVASLERQPVASCPVIVEPKATMVEVPDTDPLAADRRHDRHVASEAAWDARHDAKATPAAPFAFAEAAGWVLGPLAALNTFAPRTADRLRRNVRRRSVPEIPTRMEVGPDGDQPGATEELVGLAPAEQVLVAHGALATMGLTSAFAPLVLLCGHRSATTNNPFAAALDCGACAGKAGGPNARALAELLNRPAVRAGLADTGIRIPHDTWFVAGEHETTTDTVHVLDRHRVPVTHRDRLAQLEADLVVAGERLVVERRTALPESPGSGQLARRAVQRRSGDWAEPVPEWGLVRNAAVVVGPRSLTAGRDLERRVFLHSYDPLGDVDGVALGTILTGPLVVGHWISSQYYFSSVDPERHAAGTKPLHNVVGGIGVFEGPGGDLRVGLPLESVQFAGTRVHEPMRLLAVVQAPRERLDLLISRNSAVAQLLDNGWVRLVAGSNGPDGWAERLRDGTWSPCEPAPPSEFADTGAGGGAERPLAGSMTGGAVTRSATTEVQ